MIYFPRKQFRWKVFSEGTKEDVPEREGEGNVLKRILRYVVVYLPRMLGGLAIKVLGTLTDLGLPWNRQGWGIPDLRKLLQIER